MRAGPADSIIMSAESTRVWIKAGWKMGLEWMAEPLIGWYRENKRALPWRENRDPYRIWVSEIMLQQTRVEAVKGYFGRFMEALPDIGALAACPEQQLLKLWEGLGYYSRARNLQKAAVTVMEQYGGQLPQDYHALLKLSGFGPYTAGAVASIAYGIPVPAVDGNVLRVVSRLTASRADISDPGTKKQIGQALQQAMPQEDPGPGEFNQALMELGAVVCVPNGAPACEKCPLGAFCQAREQGIMQELPVKPPKKPRRVEERTVFVLVRDEKAAIRKRPAKGLLAGLWELPGVKGHLDQKQAVETVRGWGLEPLRIERLGEATHIFTHIEWRMQGLRVTVETDAPVDTLLWVKPCQLREEYPLPSAFRPYLAAIAGMDGPAEG